MTTEEAENRLVLTTLANDDAIEKRICLAVTAKSDKVWEGLIQQIASMADQEIVNCYHNISLSHCHPWPTVSSAEQQDDWDFFIEQRLDGFIEEFKTVVAANKYLDDCKWELCTTGRSGATLAPKFCLSNTYGNNLIKDACSDCLNDSFYDFDEAEHLARKAKAFYDTLKKLNDMVKESLKALPADWQAELEYRAEERAEAEVS